MAGGRIKGLTVTIDGDTTGLSKALQNVNKEITVFSREESIFQLKCGLGLRERIG